MTVLLGTGIAQRKLEKGYTIVRIHVFLEAEAGSSPTKLMPKV